MKVAVVYWSGTGNTEALANKVAEGIRKAGAESVLLQASSFSAKDVEEYEAFAFGCPAMGAEELEPSEFEPMFSDVESQLGGKRVVLFGSYDWGDGEWMRLWEERVKADGADVVDTLIVNNSPEEEDLALAEALGAKLL